MIADSRAHVARVACGTLHVLDTSDARGGYVLDCDSGVQIRLSKLAYRVLSAAWSGATFDEIAVASSDGERCLTVREVAHLYERIVTSVEAAEKKQRTRAVGQGFLLRLTLLPASLACRAAAPFATLFQPVAALAATPLIVLAAAYWAAWLHGAPPPMGTGELLAGYGLFLISCLAHELGHAGACIRFGVRPGSIGLALYLIFPVLYSDVTRIWRLPRRQRVAVDAGGSYVQALCGALYVFLYTQTHAPALFFAVALIIAAELLNLNPLFRFDGYWIVSDALGITGLHTHAARLVRGMALRCTGRRDPAAPLWPAHIIAFLTLYGVVAALGWAWFAVRITVYAFAQGRRLLAGIPGVGAHHFEFSLGLISQLGGTIVAAGALVYCLATLVRFIRGATSARDERSTRV